MSGKRAAILTASGWGPNVILEAKNLRLARRTGGGGLIKTWPNATTTEGANAWDLAWGPFLPLAGGATAWA